MNTVKDQINSARKNNKNKWYTLIIENDGKIIEVKGFNTWLQILRIDGINEPSNMDISVKQFNEHIDNVIGT